MNIETLIDKVTTQTVVKLKKSKLMNENQKSPFKKTEDVLRNYNKYKIAIAKDPEGTIKTQKLINIIETADESIKDDIYYDIIPMFYVDGKTREEIAEYFDCDVKTITRNKRRLVNELKVVIFSDETIEELFL